MDRNLEILDFINGKEYVKDAAASAINVENDRLWFNGTEGNMLKVFFLEFVLCRFHFALDDLERLDTLPFAVFQFSDEVQHGVGIDNAVEVNVAVIHIHNTEFLVAEEVRFLGFGAHDDIHFLPRRVSILKNYRDCV